MGHPIDLVNNRGCTGANIMMNALSIYPQGWHFLVRDFAPDPVTLVAPLVRIDHPVRYYFVDPIAFFLINHTLCLIGVAEIQMSLS